MLNPGGISNVLLKEVTILREDVYHGKWLDFSPREHVLHLLNEKERWTRVKHHKAVLFSSFPLLFPSSL